MDFVASQVDTSLFTYHKHGIRIYFLIYVDDLLVTGNDSTFIEALVTNLKAEFKIKDLDSLGYLLGIEASRDSTGLHLRQNKYILDILHRSRMVGAKPYSAPCVSGRKLSTLSGDPLENITEHQQLVGAL